MHPFEEGELPRRLWRVTQTLPVPKTAHHPDPARRAEQLSTRARRQDCVRSFRAPLAGGERKGRRRPSACGAAPGAPRVFR
ncbi:hypothetical protein GCM10027174_18590 [Salinifilum aidingensis]